ncbi:hypothetical protein [Salicibibacter kimchii]|uniref:Uncharacterized protein n=1 Tax=Salicibibacter kimchii TaxID=2099786 RepID=A0A345C293_9BACI|nr:hypothetical protein [Salicibibacter kimchii]AXF57324.1 hypothetical protein DT065_15830 [Salicibibacter kimchii]
MTTIWRMHIKPETNGGYTRKDAWEYCLQHGVIGIGYGMDKDIGEPLPSEEYIPFAEEMYHDFPGWKNSMNAFVKQMKKDDLVWLEFAGRYYLAKITGDAQYNSNVPELDLFHTRACEIKEIGGLDVVPGGIQTRFIRGRTIHRVHSSILYDYSIAVYHGTPHQVEIQDILAYLSAYDLEDLVGLYLQYKLDYKIIPSTCKPTTKRIEYTLVRKGNQGQIETAAVQVKKGDVHLKASEYIDLPYDVIYLFAENENYEKNETDERVKFISKSDVINFVKEYKSFLPSKLIHWLG